CCLPAAAAPFYCHGAYAPGAQVPVCSDGANLRFFPSVSAPLMARLPIGTYVTIRYQDTATYTTGNHTEPWYRVSYQLRDGSIMKGYVWGGALAKAAVSLPDGKLLAVGISHRDASGRKICVARVAANGTMVAQTAFPAIETDGGATFGCTLAAERIDTAGFTPSLTLVRVSFTFEACDYANGDILLTWNGHRLECGPALLRCGNENGTLATTPVFPADPGGQSDCLLLHQIFCQWTGDTEPARITSDDTAVWRLDRDRLTFRSDTAPR
ncbi:MAG TPA: SH3 domain-containing protein, partial [bacterium]|nr:SH3 domain-containing protein [bacterium]